MILKAAKLPSILRLFVFDVESIGLYGEGFSFGYQVINWPERNVLEEGHHACDPNTAMGTQPDRIWVAKHVMPSISGFDHPHPHALRRYFLRVWGGWKANDAYMVADCPFPVEMRFLAACQNQDDNRDLMPYPLLDTASILFAAGLDPLQTFKRMAHEEPEHHALNDARQSARITCDALDAIASALDHYRHANPTG